MKVPTGLYPIVDLSHHPHWTLVEVCEHLAQAGCAWMQIRAKAMPAAELTRQVRDILQLKSRYSFKLVLNSAVEVVENTGADGVHLTASSIEIEAARRRLGAQAIIGYSAHSLDEAKAAEAAGADYVTLGAIFPTPHKSDGHPIHGVAGLYRVVEALSIPVIAVGGIGEAEIPLLLPPAAPKQVHGVAVIRAILDAEDIKNAARRLSQKWKKPLSSI